MTIPHLPRISIVVALFAFAAGCIIRDQSAPAPTPASAGGGATAAGGRDVAAEAPPLRASAEAAGRHVGTAAMSHHLRDRTFAKVTAYHFNSITPENEMKWETLEPRQGSFNFAPGDAIVAFAAENKMRVRGHTLVWHSQLAAWVKKLSGDELRAAMLTHARTVAGHWKGKIAQWDVVNEALSDGDGELRADSPFTALGPTYLDDAFRAAHEADPQAQLFYNDYEIEGTTSKKSEGAYRLVKRLKEAGVPIHGIGLQMHVDPRRWPPADEIRANVDRLAALGLIVEFTEMDVPVGEIDGTKDEKLAQQKALTHDIVAACISVPKCSGVTFWGLTDSNSWLNDAHWGKLRGRLPHYPLLFDAGYKPKPALAGAADAFAGK